MKLNLNKILIADDHELIIKGLKLVLEEQIGCEIVTANNGEDALTLIRSERPELVILDIDMPKLSGFEIANILYREGASIDVIFLTMHKEEEIFNQALDIGIKGFVLKENTTAEILKCISSIAEGKRYLSSELTEFLLRRNDRLMAPASDKNGLDLLTDSERKILRKVSEMKTSQEIAEELGLSKKTVQNHRQNICKKLDLNGAHALLKFSLEHKPEI